MRALTGDEKVKGKCEYAGCNKENVELYEVRIFAWFQPTKVLKCCGACTRYYNANKNPNI